MHFVSDSVSAPPPPRRKPTGMMGFTIVWLGQLVSVIGSNMTWFALTLWAWQLTGQATALALVSFFSFAPTVLLSPLAGALIDRWNRKLILMLSDLAAGLSTIVVLGLYTTGNLEIWHLYITGAFAGAFQAFQWPAYSATITTMMPKEQYGRANGMMSLVEFAPLIVAPALAGFLIGVIGTGGVLAVDVATFLFAVGVLLLVHIPQPAATEEGNASKGTLLQESLYGFRYIRNRPGLLGLLMVFFWANFLSTVGSALGPAMVLARTGDDAQVLGTVLSAGGIGGVVGALLMSAWGGPKRRVHGVLIGIVLEGLLGLFVLGIGRTAPVWMLGTFMWLFVAPITGGSSNAIWQAKVAPDVQGRVFAARRLIGQISYPLGLIIAGPLADYVFEPAMQPGGALAGTFGEVVGVGRGAGIGLMIAFAGLATGVVGLAGYLFPPTRNVETALPDHAHTEAKGESTRATAVPVAVEV
jgi:MFS transporter, DHA3 family, macrolide efflux protein